jgi:hypothetical protein
MQDEIAVELDELSKVYIPCTNQECGAEIGFDISKKFFVTNLICPACGATIYEVDRYSNTHHEFTWPSLLQKLFGADRPRMIFRFKRPQSAAQKIRGPVFPGPIVSA